MPNIIKKNNSFDLYYAYNVYVWLLGETLKFW